MERATEGVSAWTGDATPLSGKLVVKGRCVSADRAPFQGVQIRIRRTDPMGYAAGTVVETVSRRDGVFRLAARMDVRDAYLLQLEATEHLPRTLPLRTTLPAGVLDMGDIVVRKGLVRPGVVRDDQGVLGGATVEWSAGRAGCLDRSVGSGLRGSVAANEEGGVRLRLPLGMRVVFRVSHPRCGKNAQGPTLYVLPDLLPSELSILVQASSERVVRIEGRGGRGGRGVERVAVLGWHWPRLYSHAELTVDPLAGPPGNFGIRVPPDCGAGLLFIAPGYAPYLLSPLPASPDLGVLRLTPGSARIDLRLEGVDAPMRCFIGVMEPTATDVIPALLDLACDERGRVRAPAPLGRIATSQVLVACDAAGRRWWRTAPITPETLRGPHALLLAEMWPTVPLHITCEDAATGAPVPGCRIEVLRPRSSAVSLDGEYGRITGSGVVGNRSAVLVGRTGPRGTSTLLLPSGVRFRIQARKGNQASPEVALVAVEAARRTLRLEGRGSLEVSVVPAGDRSEICLLREKGYALLGATEVHEAKRVFRGLARGTYFVGRREDLAWVMDYAPSYRKGFLGRAAVRMLRIKGASREHIDLDLPAPGWLSGRLLVPAEVLERVSLDLVPIRLDRITSRRIVRPGSLGEFAFGPIAPGRYQIRIFCASFPNLPVFRYETRVPPGRERFLELAPAWVDVTLRRLSPGEEERENWFRVKNSQGVPIGAHLIGGGTWRFALAPGSYTFEMWTADQSRRIGDAIRRDLTSGISVVTME